MSRLMNGQTYTLRVKFIKDAADQFQNKATGDVTYCHFITLVDELQEFYECQVCNTNSTQNFCSLNDTVKVKIKAFTKDRYTLEDISVVNKYNAPDHATVVTSANVHVPAMPSQGNPQLAGKASTLALNSAVTFYQNRGLGEGDHATTVLTMAEKFYQFLISKGQ